MYKNVDGVRVKLTAKEEQEILKKLEDNNEKKNLEELKNKKLKELEENYKKFIYSKYPVVEQLNTYEEEFEIRQKNIKNENSLEKLKKIDINFK